MYRIKSTEGWEPEKVYAYIKELIMSQLLEEDDRIANLSNISAILYTCLRDVNWVGFYLSGREQLILGPFQGLPACNRIRVGEGVCGDAIAKRCSILVDDVESYPGHIACDSASKSELVLPLIAGDQVFGVLDLDSPIPARFDEIDRLELEEILFHITPHLFSGSSE